MKTSLKRARMGIEQSPENSKKQKTASPLSTKGVVRKQKPSTRARTLKDMINTMGQNKVLNSGTKNIEPKESKRKIEYGMKENLLVQESAQKQCCFDKDVEVKMKSKDIINTEKQETVANVIATKPSTITSTSSKVPSGRWGHTMCLLNESEAVLIGGQGDKQMFSKDAVWHMDIGQGSWKAPKTVSEGQTQKPEARMGHTTVYDPTVRLVYMFGGSKNLKWFSDVHILDTDEWKWQVVKTNGKAPTRSYHSTTLYRHELWIFGGVYPKPDPQPDGCSNDLHVYSPMEESWYSPIVMGEKPKPRSGHSATLLGDKVVVFGGWDAPVCFNDLHVLDLCIVEWSSPKTSGVPPSPRSWHASCALAGERVLIHGGYNGNNALDDSYIFNLDTLTWTEVKLEPPIHTRVGHTSICLPYKHTNEKHDEVIIFGGGDNEGSFFNDLVCVMVPFETPNVL